MIREEFRLADIASMRTGNLDSNAAVEDGLYPFFTCAQQTLKINETAFNTKAVILGGNNATGVFPLKYYEGQFNAYQRTYVIESLDPSVLNTRFLYYLLSLALSHFQSASIGAATQYLTKGILDNFRVSLPPIETQNNITCILSAYDNLIENNQRRIQLLEQSAQLLYKEWFVHLRFPGHEHTIITDDVPEGWSKEKVATHVSFVRGVEPGSKNYIREPDDGLIPFLRVGDFGSRSSNIFIEPTFSKGNTLQPEDVAITMDGTPGRVGFGMTGAYSSGIRKIVGKNHCNIGWAFIYTLLQSDAIQTTVDRFSKGTTILHASSSIDHLEFLQPPPNIRCLFEDAVAPLLRQILLLEQKNQKLSQGRDLLMPRLMSGDMAI